MVSQAPLISVAVLAPVDRPLTYSVSPEWNEKLRPGFRVLVPLGRRKAVGVVLGKETESPLQPCKPIEGLLEEEASFTSSQLTFLQWAADYYLTPLGEMIRTALPNALTRPKLSSQRKKLNLSQNLPSSPFEKGGAGGICSTLTLTEAQRKIVENVLSSSDQRTFSVHLLHGVTGSGKTEVYLSSIERILSEGREAVSLVPEISLTPQTLRRYREHFGNRVGIYHSGLSEGERLSVWRACQKGTVSVLLGTRSALFAPFRRLGLIVVDEEQDASYKQEERARYHARDLAIVRGKIEKIPVLLGSATPSVETYAKAQSGKFHYHELSERFGEARLPKIEVVDLRTKNSLFSPRLLEEIEANLQRKEQTLLFLNRRGFSHFLLCEDCGHTPDCPNCEITLTFHRKSKKLLCHYCDHQIPPPDRCPACRGSAWLPLGSGTERIEEELQSLFPKARLARMDRDTTSRKGSHAAILENLSRREIDILVGTQMIAKGHDYPWVTLVGILSADTSLHHPDFRASEHTFQLVTQVAGRAGRAEAPGRVLLQTFCPDHESIEAASGHRVKEFYAQELQHRRELGYPPYKRLFVFRIQGTQQQKVRQGTAHLKDLLERLRQSQNWNSEILGPSPCLVEKVRNLYRWQILLKVDPSQSLQADLQREVLGTRSQWLSAGLRLIIDVDPMYVL